MRPEVSVVIPVSNGEQVVAGCLEALLDQTLPRDAYEVIVVENGSTDRTAEVIKRYPVRLIRGSVQNPYAARNTGVCAAVGSILAFTDADCRPCRQWLSAGLGAIADSAGCVAGRIEHEMTDLDNPWERFSALFFLNQQRYVSMGWAVTANLFVKRDTFKHVGPFCVAESGADKEWGLRATAMGIAPRYSEAALVYHLTRKSFGAVAAKLRRDATMDGALERRYHAGISFLSYKLLVRWPDLRPAIQLARTCLGESIAPRTAMTLLLAWPVLEVVRFWAFYRGWRKGWAS